MCNTNIIYCVNTAIQTHASSNVKKGGLPAVATAAAAAAAFALSEVPPDDVI